MKTLKEVLQEFKEYRPAFSDIDIDLADANQRCWGGDTALHIASEFGEIENVEVLLANGADVNIAGDIGYTPLHYAAAKGNTDIIKILLKAGANPNLTDEFDDTPLKVAERGHHDGAAKLLRNP